MAEPFAAVAAEPFAAEPFAAEPFAPSCVQSPRQLPTETPAPALVLLEMRMAVSGPALGDRTVAVLVGHTVAE